VLRFGKALDESWDQMSRELSDTVHIAIVGRVSVGKSSLANALLRRDRNDPAAVVGAESGVTSHLESLSLGERLRLVDSPGLEDLDPSRSDTTEDFLHRIDVGIMVVTGSADAGQVAMLERLRSSCAAVLVALNKIDQWDRHGEGALDQVLQQWCEVLEVDTVYPTCAFGYDADLPAGTPVDIRGVDELRGALEALLAAHGKELQLARHQGDKTVDAGRIIVEALRQAAGISLLPAAPWTFLVYQTAAVAKLHALHTGELLPRGQALSLIPAELADAAPSTLFLAVKFFLPVPLLLEPVAARQRVLNTFALLTALHLQLANCGSLDDRATLRRRFRKLRARAARDAVEGRWKDADFWLGQLLEITRP
jgi:small GTP-binding protein